MKAKRIKKINNFFFTNLQYAFKLYKLAMSTFKVTTQQVKRKYKKKTKLLQASIISCALKDK